MERRQYSKSLSILFILFLVVNIILFALKKISELLFWAIIIISAIFAYKILPKIK